MRATGIIRRIDDLGRVVIPKEIRRQFNIREGDPLEIFASWDGVIFKKYRAEAPVREALDTLKDVVAGLDEDDFSCRTEFLQGISELDVWLRLEEDK